MRRLVLAIGLLTTALSLDLGMQAQQMMDNTAVIKMTKAGLSPEIVAASVSSVAGHYDISPDALIALKKAGVGDTVISAMIARNAGGAPAGPGSGSASGGFGGTGAGSGAAGFGGTANATGGVPAGVDSVGLYYKDKEGGWSEVGAEVVNFKTAGALKHIGSAGIVKGDLNGHVNGFHSHLGIGPGTEFILYVPEGTSPGEYQLIRFRIGGDSREFRSLTGGVVHTSGGAARDTVEFTSKKIAPRIYSITLPSEANKGEFGFLPPVDSGGKNVNSSGKMYTFTVGE